ncbi:hypothetical protein LB503_009540 [Fusarium chuoi]|nr:hypothetical protein LB503_009540 [Fusarium chuoi]
MTENAIWVSLNQGGNPPKFESIGQVIGGFDGLKATDVRIAGARGTVAGVTSLNGKGSARPKAYVELSSTLPNLTRPVSS